MPLKHTDKGWYWGSRGPFPTKAKALSVARAAFASGYKGEMMLQPRQYTCGEFILTLFHAQSNTHILHLQTRSYAEHKALQEFYEEVGDLADTYAEAYQGKYGIVDDYPVEYDAPTGAIEYLVTLNEYVAQARAQMPQDSELQNIIDEIVALIDSTLYKLRFLK